MDSTPYMPQMTVSACPVVPLARARTAVWRGTVPKATGSPPVAMGGLPFTTGTAPVAVATAPFAEETTLLARGEARSSPVRDLPFLVRSLTRTAPTRSNSQGEKGDAIMNLGHITGSRLSQRLGLALAAFA
jgi:hypothetical protein